MPEKSVKRRLRRIVTRRSPPTTARFLDRRQTGRRAQAFHSGGNGKGGAKKGSTGPRA